MRFLEFRGWMPAVTMVVATLFHNFTFAAQETEVTGYLHGQVGIQLHGETLRGRLTERTIEVGRYIEGRSGPKIDVRFGAFPGVELFATIPYITNGYRSYQEVAAMCGDAANLPVGTIVYEGTQQSCTQGSTIYADPSTGKYVANPGATTLPAYTFGGIDDAVIGLRFAPLHEANLGSFKTGRKAVKRPLPPLATWRVELGIIPRTADNFYSQGAGSGASGFQLGSSFSKRMGVAEPYLALSQRWMGTTSATQVDDDGEITSVELRVPNRSELLFGVELTPYEDRKSGARFSVNFGGGGQVNGDLPQASFRRTEEDLATIEGGTDVISGTALPSVVTSSYSIDGTAGEVVRQEEQVSFLGTIQLNYQIMRYIRASAGASLVYDMPRKLEAPYAIVLGRTLRSQFGAGLTVTF